MSGGYGNFLDKVRAKNYATVRSMAGNNVTINGPNAFTCVQASPSNSECCDNNTNTNIKKFAKLILKKLVKFRIPKYRNI